jgi:RimJ/RimL family protein N-acetyltransferase
MNDYQNISYRKATSNDVMLYFDWANDPAVRANSFNSERINLENHRKWFLREIENPKTLMLVFEFEGIPFGQTRFHIDRNESLLNYSIHKGFRGQGLGTPMIRLAIEELHKVQPNIQKILAKVKVENNPSISVLERCGFRNIISKTEEMTYVYEYAN